jgi:hypothetical protein
MPVLASRPPSALGPHLLLAAACLAALLVAVSVVVLTTRRRARRAAAAMPTPAGPPRPFPIPLITPMPGVALGTTAPNGWRDAAVTGVLGSRRSGELTVTCGGVDIAGLWLPRPALRSIRVDERFATKFMPGAGLLVIGWEIDGRPYESGFRGAATGYGEVVAAVRGLLEREVADQAGGKGTRP